MNAIAEESIDGSDRAGEGITFLTEGTSEDISQISEESCAIQCNNREIKFIIDTIDSGARNHLVDGGIGQFLVNAQEVSCSIKVAKPGKTMQATKKGNAELEN
ncbi:unnamed protein product [Ceutorhynchus assimilis]|uniref:Uncharacterized protein n=1 Tax=Ceutorhynchus assimilis TaxID=467358 RepID=A0A9N9MGR2_9CUCU|nr:unnamed protein product [Ceutorhynchus assimilis]